MPLKPESIIHDKVRNLVKTGGWSAWLYHVKRKGHGPCGSVCILQSPLGAYYRGISICSILDEFNKRVGALKAMGRAYSATCGRINVIRTIREKDEEKNSSKSIHRFDDTMDKAEIRVFSSFKGEVHPELSDWEKRLVKVNGNSKTENT